MDNNNYGALNNDPEPGSKGQRQKFDIGEPSYGNPRASGCCGGSRRGETDGFKIIVISMFVLAVGVTVALIITIASGNFYFYLFLLVFISVKNILILLEPSPIHHYANVVTSDHQACSEAGQDVLKEVK